MPDGRHPDRILDRRDASGQVLGGLARVHPQLQTVPVPMQRDRVTALCDPGDQLGSALHLLADHEEGRTRARSREHFQYRRRALGVRPIVERQRHPPGSGQPAGQRQSSGSGEVDGREDMADHGVRDFRDRTLAMDRGRSPGPDLDAWLPDPGLRVVHRRTSQAGAAELWQAGQQLRLGEAGLLGRLIRWRIPGLDRDTSFDHLFREPPFMVLEEGEHQLVSGLVGRIWTLRRDYPRLADADEYLAWSARGTARVLFAIWVRAGDDDSEIFAEVRVQTFGVQGRVGMAAVRPLVRRFQGVIGSDGLRAVVRRAEGRG
jgi:hypothetical protein